jgi:hypothetical protein
VFDFDDTLVKTDAKIHIYINNKKIKSLTPAEYNFYKPKPNETLDFSDFSDARIIMAGKKYKMWSIENFDKYFIEDFCITNNDDDENDGNGGKRKLMGIE